MNKLIFKFEDIKDKLKEAVNIIADPIRQTLSPMGSNVLYEDARGDQYVTNDGVTIAKSINVKDPIHNAIIEVIKQPALQTNHTVGDGTTTSILLSQVLIMESLKLLDEGMNRMKLKQNLENMGEKIKARLKTKAKKVVKPADVFQVAKISANNDDVIAKDVVRVVEVAGPDGMVFIEPHHKIKTELIEEVGFNVDSPLNPALGGTGFSVIYDNIPTLITDKNLYYREEAETILKTVLKSGWDKVAIVAKDFTGKALPYFVSNHENGIVKVLLIKDPSITATDSSSASDLATYLGGTLFTDKQGKIVDKLTPKDFVMAKKIISNRAKTLILTANKDNDNLKALVENMKAEIEKSKDDKELKKRLSAITTGMVTVKVGGRTPIEVQERMFRYEDSVNAARAAIKDGYLVGGGLSLLDSFKDVDHGVMKNVARRFCESSVRQIAENCGKHIPSILEQTIPKEYWGYNAKTDKFCNLLEAGVLDPYKVTEMAVDNSISIAIHLLTSGYFILNDIEDYNKNNNNKNGKESN